MSFKNKTQLINNINKVITSNNKSPTKKNLKKLDRMAKTNYPFLDQTGGAVVRETLDILRENYKNNYATKPNTLEKNYIEAVLEQVGGKRGTKTAQLRKEVRKTIEANNGNVSTFDKEWSRLPSSGWYEKELFLNRWAAEEAQRVAAEVGKKRVAATTLQSRVRGTQQRGRTRARAQSAAATMFQSRVRGKQQRGRTRARAKVKGAKDDAAAALAGKERLEAEKAAEEAVAAEAMEQAQTARAPSITASDPTNADEVAKQATADTASDPPPSYDESQRLDKEAETKAANDEAAAAQRVAATKQATADAAAAPQRLADAKKQAATKKEKEDDMGQKIAAAYDTLPIDIKRAMDNTSWDKLATLINNNPNFNNLGIDEWGELFDKEAVLALAAAAQKWKNSHSGTTDIVETLTSESAMPTGEVPPSFPLLELRKIQNAIKLAKYAARHRAKDKLIESLRNKSLKYEQFTYRPSSLTDIPKKLGELKAEEAKMIRFKTQFQTRGTTPNSTIHKLAQRVGNKVRALINRIEPKTKVGTTSLIVGNTVIITDGLYVGLEGQVTSTSTDGSEITIKLTSGLVSDTTNPQTSITIPRVSATIIEKSDTYDIPINTEIIWLVKDAEGNLIQKIGKIITKNGIKQAAEKAGVKDLSKAIIGAVIPPTDDYDPASKYPMTLGIASESTPKGKERRKKAEQIVSELRKISDALGEEATSDADPTAQEKFVNDILGFVGTFIAAQLEIKALNRELVENLATTEEATHHI